jgi:hypothetical protein
MTPLEAKELRDKKATHNICMKSRTPCIKIKAFKTGTKKVQKSSVSFDFTC